MPFTITVQLTSAGADTGPFDIYYQTNAGIFGPIVNDVPKAALLAPAFLNVTVPDGTIGIVVKSDNIICNDTVIVEPPLPCYCYEVNALAGSATIDYIACESVGNEITSIDLDSEKAYLCAKISSVTKRNQVGTVNIIGGIKLCDIDDDCYIEPPLCHEVEIIGTSTITWTGFDGDTSTFTYSNVTINVCAYRGSVTSVGGTVNITVGTTYCEQESECWPALELQAVGINKFMIRQLGIWGAPFTPNQAIIPWMIDYGDGFTASFTGTQTFLTGGPADHTYASPFTGIIKIKAPTLQIIRTIVERASSQSYTTGSVTLIGTELIKLENLYSFQNIRWEVNAAANQIPANINEYYSLNGTITGAVADLPNSMTKITLLGGETNLLTGSIADFPTGMTSIRIDGNNQITGDVSTLPPTFAAQLVNFIILGQNTIDGNLVEFLTYTALREFEVRGFNELTGSICNFNNQIRNIIITGYSYPSGNVSCLSGHINLEVLSLAGDEDDPGYPVFAGNTVTGDIANLPDSLRTTQIYGKNTLSGNISNMPTGILVDPTPGTVFDVRGLNLITGTLASINPNCYEFSLSGNNTMSGNISTLPTTLRRFSLGALVGGDISGIVGDLKDLPAINLISFALEGNHQVGTYTAVGKIWTPSMTYFYVKPNDTVTYALPTAQIDNLLIDLNATTWIRPSNSPVGYVNAIYLIGARSAASNAAVLALQTRPAPNAVSVTTVP